jgi:hypothetical protein
MDLMPAVFLFPLLLVTTAVFDETVLLFVFAGMLALVSTTPCRGGLPALVFAWLVLSVVLHPAKDTAPPSTSTRDKVRRIGFVPPVFML